MDNPTGILEPLVGSSIMLISSQPISQSLTFTPTQAITTTGSVEVRLGPGTNYASTGIPVKLGRDARGAWTLRADVLAAWACDEFIKRRMAYAEAPNPSRRAKTRGGKSVTSV